MKNFPPRESQAGPQGGPGVIDRRIQRIQHAFSYPQNQGENMNNRNASHDIIVSGIHLDLTPSLKFYVKEKMERLFRHDERIVRVKVELECDRKHDREHKFIAKAHLQVRGPDINATVSSEDCHKSIDLLVDKLDQSLRKRHGMAKDKRNHPHPVEWQDVALPKAV
jgi:putative sigma-54 modulation protein